MKVLVLGANGKLGQQVVASCLARGHAVTAAMRQPDRFRPGPLGEALPRLRLVQIDGMHPTALDAALATHDAAISTAGNVEDDQLFVALFDQVVSSAERIFGTRRRLWMLAGAMVLDIPHAGRIGVGLPFVPPRYASHLANWKRLERSTLDWALMCPGPMVAGDDHPAGNRLTVSVDTLPIDVGRWTGMAPPFALSLMVKNRLPQLKVPYRGIADVIAGHLVPGDRFSKRRVGVGWSKVRAAEPLVGVAA